MTSEQWVKRKAIANQNGTCPYHIHDVLQDGRCQRCLANSIRRLENAKLKGVCPNHPTEHISNGICNLCLNNERKRRDSLERAGKCSKHSQISLIDGNCSECLKKLKDAEVNNVCRSHTSVKLENGRCCKCDSYRANKRQSCKLTQTCVQHPDISIVVGPCFKCAEKYTRRQQHTADNNTCFNHPAVFAITGSMCFDCWCTSIAGDALGSKRLKEMVMQSYIQHPYCAFTGELVLPGHQPNSASMDHIVPISRGGEKVIENCQWVKLIINVSKNNKTNEEYLDELRRIYEGKNHEFNLLNSISVERMVKNDSSQICGRCKSSRYKHPKPPEIGSLCKKHYFEFKSLRHFNTVRYAENLEILFLQQGGVCYYSRVPLVLGSSDREVQASLDHTIPLEKGGAKSVTNIRWVTSRLNTLKQNMTEEELIAFVDYVIEQRLTF